MIQTIELFPGVTLRCIPDNRFKHGCLSLAFLRPMDKKEAAQNALLPAVLLRGCQKAPDLRAITQRLDDLYGAGIGALVRRVGDWQTTGFYCSFTEDRYAMTGDEIFRPLMEFLRQLLLEPLSEGASFRRDFVDSEKKNLISTIESQKNDKRAYAMDKLMRAMCKADSFGIPRLGLVEDVQAITAEGLYSHYQKILKESPVHLFYVGAQKPERVAQYLKPLFAMPGNGRMSLAPQTPFQDGGGEDFSESMDVNQGKLCMGFVTPITIRDEGFVAMQLANMVFGGGMTNKLFMNIREKMSLCYAVGSAYRGAKGIVTVSAGIDFAQEKVVRQAVLEQLEACQKGQITPEELCSAKESLRSSLLSVHDSPGAMENYYASAALSGLKLTVEQYLQEISDMTVEQVARAAASIRLHSVFFLKGVTQ